MILALRVPRFPLGQLDAIARQRFIVQVEHARRAAAVAAVFQFGLYGRGRTRIVGERRSVRGGRLGHGFGHRMSNAKYTVARARPTRRRSRRQQAQARQTLADIQDVRAALGAHVQDVRSLFQYRTDIDTFMQPATFAPRSSPSRVP
ncbi:hypothetical protein BLAT2472_30020 [Burkholderia latens]